MDLGNPLATLASPLEAGVLRVLLRADIGFSGRQIHRLSGVGSAPGVWKALGRLTAAGLITAEQRPAETLYRLNRNHLLFPAIDAALNTGSELRERIARAAETHAPTGTIVVLFGSVARGEATSESDVDLLIVSAGDSAHVDLFRDRLAADVETWTGNQANVIALTRQQLNRMLSNRDPLAQSWVSEGNAIIGSLDERDS